MFVHDFLKTIKKVDYKARNSGLKTSNHALACVFSSLSRFIQVYETYATECVF